MSGQNMSGASNLLESNWGVF